jgi:hypothetical protein
MKNTRLLVINEDAKIVGRATADVGPRQPIDVPPSPESGLTLPGGKCEHGVYIPSQYLHLHRAPDCSNCHPYEIVTRKNAAFKA